MHKRGVTRAAVELTLSYGRQTYVRGARYYSIGRKEIRRHRERCPEMARHEGLHVVTQANGTILTVYKNRGFRVLRPTPRIQWANAGWSCS